MPRELWVLAVAGEHQTAKSLNSEAVSLGKGEPSGHGGGSWSLASKRERGMDTQCGHRGRGRGLLNINLKGTQSWGELLPPGGLVQEVPGDAPPLPSSPLSGTFSFSSAPETISRAGKAEPAVGEIWGQLRLCDKS